MPQLTDEEYAALDEKLTRAPVVNFSRSVMFNHQRILLESLDTVVANYIYVLAESAGKTPPDNRSNGSQGNGSPIVFSLISKISHFLHLFSTSMNQNYHIYFNK